MTTKQKTRSHQVAETIIQQMGGPGRLKAMINAKMFIHGEDENGICHVSFRHMSGGPRVAASTTPKSPLTLATPTPSN